MARFVLTLIGLVSAMACSAHNPARPSDLVSVDAFVRLLEHGGARVSVGEQMPRDSFPFFAVTAQRLLVNGESVFVFAYPDAAAAAVDAARVHPTGSPVGSTQVTWTDPPRFYTRGQLIVLYVGRSQTTASFVDTVMGGPFAGIW